MTVETVSIRDFDAKRALLVMFICRHCPYVKHVRAELARLGRDFADSELAIVAISANDPDEYPEDAPEGLAEDARDRLRLPVPVRQTQEVAKAYTAACTPDLFLFDADRALVYRGSSTTAARATGSRSPGRTSAPRSTRSFRANRSRGTSARASAAASSGARATNPRTPSLGFPRGATRAAAGRRARTASSARAHPWPPTTPCPPARTRRCRGSGRGRSCANGTLPRT